MKEKYHGSKERIVCDHLHLCSGGVHWVVLGQSLSLHQSEIRSPFQLQQHQYWEEKFGPRISEGSDVDSQGQRPEKEQQGVLCSNQIVQCT